MEMQDHKLIELAFELFTDTADEEPIEVAFRGSHEAGWSVDPTDADEQRARILARMATGW